MTEFKRL